mgnify:CR=1 FL=1
MEIKMSREMEFFRFDKINYLPIDQGCTRTTDPSRVVFGYGIKDSLHVLRDCPKAREIWELLLPQDIKANLFNIIIIKS